MLAIEQYLDMGEVGRSEQLQPYWALRHQN